MTNDDDRLALSRLALGDLPDGEAHRLRDRIDHEPALAATWAVMIGLPDKLGDLAEPPPPALISAVLGPTPRPRSGFNGMWIALAMAAGLLLGLFAGSTPVAIVTLEPGSAQTVRGEVNVLAGGLQVAVSGESRIVWEPVEAGWRVTPRSSREEQGEQMTRVFAGIGIGAVVAITVIEGTARLSGTEGERVLVAGTELSVPVPYTTDAEEAHVGEPGAAKRVVPAKQEEEPPEAARLREHNEELAFENALLRGRLEGTEGVPQPWPEDVPNSFREPGVRAALTEAFGEDATLAVLECEEYPCIALAELDPEAYPDLPGATAAMRTAYETALGIVPEGFFVADVTDEAGNARMIVGTLVLPSDAEPSAELMTRTESRAHTAMDDLLQDGS